MSEISSAVKNAINPKVIFATLLVLIVIFAFADAVGYTTVIISPYTWFKAKFFPSSSSSTGG